ncbi:MAG: toxin-antitoxin system HicB family antitoxin [Crocosphaera sp.]
MTTIKINFPEEKHLKLQSLAETKGVSVNQLIQEVTTLLIEEFEVEKRFRKVASQGNIEEGLQLLDKLDKLTEKSELG